MLGHIRRVASPCLLGLTCLLAGCQTAPVKSPPPPPSPVTPTQTPAAATTPAVVEASVTTAPQGKTRVSYRISFTVPKGVNSISVVLPDLAPAVPAPVPAAAGGEAQECNGGFFGCSKFIAETVSAVIAAIVALIGLIQLLRKKRRGKR